MRLLPLRAQESWNGAPRVRLQSQRLDMVVDGRVVLEIKSTPGLHPSARQQLHNYLRLTRYQVGLLLQFGPEPSFTRLIHTDKR